MHLWEIVNLENSHRRDVQTRLITFSKIWICMNLSAIYLRNWSFCDRRFWLSIDSDLSPPGNGNVSIFPEESTPAAMYFQALLKFSCVLLPFCATNKNSLIAERNFEENQISWRDSFGFRGVAARVITHAGHGRETGGKSAKGPGINSN